MTSSLLDIQPQSSFKSRHIGLSPTDIKSMLASLNVNQLETLITQAVPDTIYDNSPIALAEGCAEEDALAKIKAIAKQNKVLTSYMGLGYYNTITPPVILRNVLENPSWYTPYTPYQSEISQGRLEMLIAFQQMIVDLTAMEVANASLLDEATAAVEAMLMCWRITKLTTATFLVDQYCHPQTIALLQLRADPLGIAIQIADFNQDITLYDFFGCVIQYPNTLGDITDIAAVINLAHEKQAVVAIASDLLSLALLKAPGELAADIAFGNSQRFGVPLGYGGPHAAFFATKDKYKRFMPGRIIGISQDKRGKVALRMSLQTREQHIRREKANSNICTAQSLLAVIATCYAIYHGPQKITAIARKVHHLTKLLATGLAQLDYELINKRFFDTLTIKTNQASNLLNKAVTAGINLHQVTDSQISIALDETTTAADVITLLTIFGATDAIDLTNIDKAISSEIGITADDQRQSQFLTSPIFNSYHSETAMMRYLKYLADKDIGLDRGMIALGSCTMKLNAAAEMIPVTWPEFGQLHPFVPLDQAQGYKQLFTDLENMLCQITGYAAVSLQPNAGSQGELAGLLAIRAYHKSRGEAQRNTCLIPTSAHGTNPASAIVAGLKVVTVKCDNQGNIDLEDLIAKADEHSQNLAVLMVTYPSTHGVYEEKITEICKIIHDHGGQIYLDGANLNSLLGIAYPGKFGADVSHINLHKTFAIPHGGGGPGMGPIGVGAHLAEFLPGHNVVDIHNANGKNNIGPVSAAPWGSAGILPISWLYIQAVGNDGLKESSRAAILSANYIAKRLGNYYPVLYAGNHDRVAHECILDLRPFKVTTKITDEDVAKRLIDYGFHAPTMSFPVTGTLMIEPTESESKDEIDRFCDAMISIHGEITKVENGSWPQDDNPIKNAPHTAADITDAEWTHPYTREEAVYPVDGLRDNKYWPSVNRVDNIYGDRNFSCDVRQLVSVKF